MNRLSIVRRALAVGAVLGLAPLAAASADEAPTPGSWTDLAVRGAATAPSARTMLSSPQPALPSDPSRYSRMAGADRYATAVAVSKAMVCSPTDTGCGGLGGAADPVDLVFVASGANYPDALGAGPLAAGLGPLLLVPKSGTVPTVVRKEITRIKPSFIVVIGGTSAVSTGIENQLEALVGSGQVARESGADRYATAAGLAEVNDSIWREADDDGDGQPDDHGLDTIVLATGTSFADALGGGGAAANSRGSLMLTPGTSLPSRVRSTLKAINPPTVVIAGGTGVISPAVEAAVKAALPSSKVVRAAGSDRYRTAVALSKTLFGDADEVLVVSGKNFPDALASAPYAGVAHASTLLTPGSCVSTTTRDEAARLSPDWVTAAGGTAAVSNKALFLGLC